MALLVFSSAPVPALDTELDRYEPHIRYVEDGETQFGYDAGLLELSDGQRVADAMRQTYGEAGFPLVFKVPGEDGFFLVSSSADHHGDNDFGRRFFLLRADGRRLDTVFRGEGMGDSYSLTPTFYTGAGRVLVLAEIGTEYTWGLQAYEFADDVLVSLGSLDVALWDGENHVNPLERASAWFGAAGYRVQFPYDLTLNPGGLHQWKLPRLNDTITFTQRDHRFVLSDDSVGHQVCFFFLGEPDDKDTTELLADLLHYYEKLIPWLEEHDIAFSFQRDSPLRMVASRGGEITIGKADLKAGLGVVLISMDGRRKILSGVSTDVDLIHELESLVGGRIGPSPMSAEDMAFKSSHLAVLRPYDPADESQKVIWSRMLRMAADFDDSEIIDRIFDLIDETDGVGSTQYCLDLFTLLQRDPLFVVTSAHRYFEGDFQALLRIWINESFEIVIEDLIEATRPVRDDPLVKEFLDDALRMNAELWSSAAGG